MTSESWQMIDSKDWGRPTTYPLPCVWLIRRNMERQVLRRYSTDNRCTSGSWCSGETWLGDVTSTLHPTMEGDHTTPYPHADPDWPKTCDVCGQKFTKKDGWQFNRIRLYEYKGPYGHHLVDIRSAPPGSVYSAKWLEPTKKYPHSWAIGPDGLALHAVCPDGRHWHIDGIASNCTMPEDNGSKGPRQHYCWVRHGDPRHPSTLHVDKNGPTCQAGAGSIMTGTYHGFLHNGGFTPG